MKKLVLATSLAALLSTNLYAKDVSIVGTIPTIVETNSHSITSFASKHTQPNVVLLQKIQLSPSAKKAFAQRVTQIKQTKNKVTFNQNDTALPDSLDLGMNDTPVLNQGAHGSCVTFANAGAIDALIGEGDYVSELCSLTLGNYLEQEDSNYPSGWNGSYGPIVLEQFFEYGIVSMDQQKSEGCGGLTSYPVWNPYEEGSTTSPEDYAKMSESLSDRFEWKALFSQDLAFISGKYNPNKVVKDVKKALNNGNRVTFGVLLDVAYGSNGAVGKHHVRNDTWMLTPAIEKDAKNDNIDAGHEMVIIGYDDNEVVSDNNGHENKGLFILRNSWGKSAGDQGNYYMTYDHFKLMVMETQVIRKKS